MENLHMLLVFLPLVRHVDCYVLSADKRFSTWNGNVVPFTIAHGYSQAELNTIRAAANQVQTDMGGCIRFQELGSGAIPANTNYVIISQSGGPGVPSSTCYSFPGRVLPVTNPPSTYGQHMAMMNGPNGCLGSIRQAMRFFAYLLGLRAEHNKPNRDNFIVVNLNNVSPEALQAGAFNVYDPSIVMFNTTDFDPYSVSSVDPLSYSRNGLPVITSRDGRFLFNGGRLSYRDCQAISAIYGCMIQCPIFY